MTPGALDVVLRFFSSTPATPESTLDRSDVSADIVVVCDRSDRSGIGVSLYVGRASIVGCSCYGRSQNCVRLTGNQWNRCRNGWQIW